MSVRLRPTSVSEGLLDTSCLLTLITQTLPDHILAPTGWTPPGWGANRAGWWGPRGRAGGPPTPTPAMFALGNDEETVNNDLRTPPVLRWREPRKQSVWVAPPRRPKPRPHPPALGQRLITSVSLSFAFGTLPRLSWVPTRYQLNSLVLAPLVNKLVHMKTRSHCVCECV